MKAIWYLSATLLLVGIVAGFASITPTGAVIVNIPPRWDFPTDNIVVSEDPIEINCYHAFFDPDGDKLEFNAFASEGVHTTIAEDKLLVQAEKSGFIYITANDGKKNVTKAVAITKI